MAIEEREVSELHPLWFLTYQLLALLRLPSILPFIAGSKPSHISTMYYWLLVSKWSSFLLCMKYI